jgi:hypothetical protein
MKMGNIFYFSYFINKSPKKGLFVYTFRKNSNFQKMES